MGIEYQGYSFLGGFMMMLGNCVFWTCLGLYLDQVIPSQFGIAKPWNFCCIKKKGSNAWQGTESMRANLLGKDDIGDK